MSERVKRKYEVYRTLRVSTAHLSASDLQILKAERAIASLVDPYRYGWRVYCYEEDEGELSASKARWLNLGSSKTFTDLLELACRLGCAYLEFDADGPSLGSEGFAEYPWSK